MTSVGIILDGQNTWENNINTYRYIRFMDLLNLSLTLLHSERSKLHRVLVVLNAIGLNNYLTANVTENLEVTTLYFPQQTAADKYTYQIYMITSNIWT